MLQSKIVASWDFDDPTNRVKDSSPKKLDLSTAGALPDFISSGGKPSGYASVSASNQCFQINSPKNANFSFGNSVNDVDFGFDCFIRFGTVGSNMVIVGKKSNVSGAVEWQLATAGAAFRLILFDTKGTSSSTDSMTFTTGSLYAANTIYHIAFNYIAATKTATFFLNGVSQTFTKTTSGSYVAMWATSSIPFQMCGNGLQTGITLMDTAHVIRGNFDSSDLAFLYNGGAGNNIIFDNAAILSYGYNY